VIIILLTRPDKPFDEFSSFDLLKIYARCCTFKDSARLVNVSRQAFAKKWYDEGLPSPRTTRTTSSDNVDLPYKEVAIVSDTHFGSIYQQKTIFDNFINDCKDRNISTLVHCGDVVDGLMPQKYHSEERFLNTTSEFEQYVQKYYPSGFDTNIITAGNHEKTLSKEDWHYDFCKEIAIRRSDLTYIPKGTPIVGPGNVIFNVHHGGGSCASPGQNRTRRMRNCTLRLMSEGQFGHIFIQGHCHSVAYIPSYMNVAIIGVGCFQAPNDYLIKSYGGADVCGLILGYCINELGQPVNLKLDFRYASEYGGLIKNDF
jgi:hypothetical protein